MSIEFAVLGELRAWAGGAELDLGGRRQKALLARLLVARNELVARDRLVADLYGTARSGAKALHVGVGRLRRALGEVDPESRTGLVSRDGGYLLAVTAEQLDSERFERRLRDAEDALASGDGAAADRLLEAALALWRGAPLAEFPGAPWARGEVARLEEMGVRARELRAEVALVLGGHERAIPELEELVATHPARERARELLMLALYRAGRQADALAAYRDARRHLVEEHGIEPGSALRDLERAILLQDPQLDDWRTGARHRPPDRSSEMAGAGEDARQPQPFVGRVSERAALDAALERCAGGQSVAALISGESGIGKTRMAGELAARARASGFQVLSGRCDGDLDLPFKPFVEALGQLLESADRGRVEPRLHEHGAVLARMLPPLAGPIGPLGAAPAPPEPAVGANGLHYALFAAVAGLLLDASRARPLLLVLEDLHWADRSSLLLLKHLLATPARPRLMLVGTYRAGDLGPHHPLRDLLADLHRQPGVLRLDLVGLLDGEIAELVRAIAGPRVTLRPGTARALRRGTAGNPFFVTEVLRALIDRGEELRDWDPDESLPLPAGIRETVTSRVARLGEPAGACLAAASVLGVAFDPELVAHVADRPAGEVLDALDTALAAGLLVEEAEQMTFRHALIAQTLYESLSSARRRALHLRAAEAMEERGAAGVPVAPAAVARQWLRAGPRAAGEVETALRCLRRAGDDASAKLAPHAAQRWYREALSLSERRGDAAQHDRCELLIELGAAQRQSGDPAFRDTLLEAARIAHAGGDRAQLVRAALANTRGFVSATGGVDDERIAVLEDALEAAGPERTATRARLLATLAGELTFTGDWRRCAALSDEALAIARDHDLQTLVDVLSPRNVTIWTPATLAQRLADTAECRRAADVLGDPLAQFQSVHWRASTCIESGAFAEAAECRERGRRLAGRLRQPTALWMAGYDHANEAIVAGRLDEAERLAGEAFGIGQASGQPDALLILAAQLMVIRYEQGRLGETIDMVAQSLDENPRVTGFRSVLALGYCEERRHPEAAAVLGADAEDGFAGLAYDLTWLSVTCVYAHVATRLAAVGRAEDGVLRTLRELLSPSEDQIAYTGAGGWGCVQHYLGMLDLALGEPERARERLEHALRRAERLPAPIWAAHSRLELARASVACGARGPAEELLRRCCREAEALGCRSIARDAGELLAEVALDTGAV